MRVSRRGGRGLSAIGCVNCHGAEGKADGKESLEGTLKDTRGLRIQATDLTALISFKNGATPGDIYRSIMTGFDGAPMPSYEATFKDHEADLWHLVNYVRSLSNPLP